MSVFEPYPMRDTVQHFCEKHLEKIKSYMESLMVKLPLPVKCTGKNHALKIWDPFTLNNIRVLIKLPLPTDRGLPRLIIFLFPYTISRNFCYIQK